MKRASSCPNLNRETTSFPNFFTFFQDPDHHDDTTLNKRPKIEHSEDTEASETSPFKDILSPILPFNEMNENHFPIDRSFYRRDQMDQTTPRWPPSPNGSDTNVSVGSNQFIGHNEAESRKLPWSRFKGVVPQPKGRWGAQIYEKHQRVWLGTFNLEEEAARAYDVAAQRFCGPDAVEIAFLNSHSKAEIVDMLRKHTYNDELEQCRRSYTR